MIGAQFATGIWGIIIPLSLPAAGIAITWWLMHRAKKAEKQRILDEQAHQFNVELLKALGSRRERYERISHSQFRSDRAICDRIEFEEARRAHPSWPKETDA